MKLHVGAEQSAARKIWNNSCSCKREAALQGWWPRDIRRRIYFSPISRKLDLSFVMAGRFWKGKELLLAADFLLDAPPSYLLEGDIFLEWNLIPGGTESVFGFRHVFGFAATASAFSFPIFAGELLSCSPGRLTSVSLSHGRHGRHGAGVLSQGAHPAPPYRRQSSPGRGWCFSWSRRPFETCSQVQWREHVITVFCFKDGKCICDPWPVSDGWFFMSFFIFFFP